MRDVSVLLLITRDDHRQFPDRSEHGSERTVRIEPERDFATVRRADETRVVLTAALAARTRARAGSVLSGMLSEFEGGLREGRAGGTMII